MMTSACEYHCSLCKVTPKTGKGWLHHLLSSEHQVGFQEDIVSWDSPTRERVLVVFGKFSVGTESVLEAFTGDDGRSPLSGFAWNENCPRVGLLLFESREKVEEILKNFLKEGWMQVENIQFLQLKKAADYLELEWEIFVQDFSSEFDADVESEIDAKTEQDDDENLSTNKRVKLELSSSKNSDMDWDKATTSCSNSSSSSDEYQPRVNDIMVEPEQLPGPPAPPTLATQLDLICQEIEIKTETYDAALAFMEKCRSILNKDFKGCKLFMFRNCFLKLSYYSWLFKEFYIYFDAEGVLDNINGGTVFGSKATSTSPSDGFLASLSAGAQSLPGLRSRDAGKELRKYFFDGEPSMYRFHELLAGLDVTFVSDPCFAIEVQTFRLLNYLLDFDPRARPFFSLVFYWAKQNELKLNESRHAYYCAPEGTGLDWLVIFFLCRKKILPTPREILERPHPQVICSFFDHQLDIGFRMDPQFAQEWNAAKKANGPHLGSSEFALQLIELSKEFFTFYGEFPSKLDEEEWVLNTKDGEILRREDLLPENPNLPREFVTRLEKRELMLIRSPAQGNQNNVNKKLNKLNGLDNWNLVLNILQPLNLQWKVVSDEFHFLRSICPVMRPTTKRIEKWLITVDEARKSGVEVWEKVAGMADLFGKVSHKDRWGSDSD